MLRFDNDEQRLVATNYWESEQAQSGYCFLSWNAGAARLLVPDSLRASINEMRTASYVIVSRGPWQVHGGREALELLFEDGTDSPYCLTLVTEQTDRLLPEDNQGGGFVVTVWTKSGGEVLRLPGKYRTVSEIPCLMKWVEQ